MKQLRKCRCCREEFATGANTITARCGECRTQCGFYYVTRYVHGSDGAGYLSPRNRKPRKPIESRGTK